MLKELSALAFCLLAEIALSDAQVTSPVGHNSLLLVPMPREIQSTSGSVDLQDVHSGGQRWKPQLETGDPQDAQALDMLKSALPGGLEFLDEKAGGERQLVITTGTAEANEPPLFREQGYELRIEPNRIAITGLTSTGRFYGIQTLRQLIIASSGMSIPCMTIRDWPDLEWRGISDDISRGQVSMVEDFKRVIRQLAFFKKNLYQPYIEDMFQFSADPNIGADRGAITKQEMAQIVEEGRRYHVVVSPVLECLGHQDRLLSLPENRPYAEMPGAEDKPWSFAPSNPEALAFVTKLLDEIVDATPDSPFFHIGGDESWDVGKGVSKQRAQEIGIGRLHAEWFTKLHDHLASRGRKTLLYGDMLLHHPDSLEVLPKDCIIIDWHYDANGPFPSVQKIRDLGFKYVFTSPGLSSWSTFYPNYQNGFANIANFTAAGRAAGIIGSITSSWGDNGAENLRENNMVGFAFSAATEWETTAPQRDEFLHRYVAQQYGPFANEITDAIKFLGWGLPQGIGTWNSLLHQNIRIKSAKPDLVKNMITVKGECERVREALGKMNQNKFFGEGSADAENPVDVLLHCLDRVRYLAARIITLDDIAAKLQKGTIRDLAQQDRDQVSQSLNGLRDELAHIIADYPRLWLRSNKYPKLDDNLTRLQSQLAQLQGFVAEAQSGELAAYPPMEGVWFWYPEPDPVTTGTKYFVREFDLSSEPQRAQIRLFCDDSGRAFINGRGVAEAKYETGSTDRDALAQLKKGHNFLAVQCTNEVGAAGVLLDLVIKLRDGSTVQITGDNQWRSCDEKQTDASWRSQPVTGACWKQVRLLGPAPLAPWNDIE